MIRQLKSQNHYDLETQYSRSLIEGLGLPGRFTHSGRSEYQLESGALLTITSSFVFPSDCTGDIYFDFVTSARAKLIMAQVFARKNGYQTFPSEVMGHLDVVGRISHEIDFDIRSPKETWGEQWLNRRSERLERLVGFIQNIEPVFAIPQIVSRIQ